MESRVNRSIITCVVLVLILTSGPFELAQAGKIDVSRVPAVVIKAFRAKYPHAKIESTHEEKDGTDVTYRIEFEANNLSTTVEYATDGSLEELEQEIALTKLPKAVSDAAKKKYPKGKLDYAGEVTTYEDGKPQPKTYRVVTILAPKVHMILEITAKGEITHEEEDEDVK